MVCPLEKNTGIKFLDFRFGNSFFAMTSKAQPSKATLIKWDYTK